MNTIDQPLETLQDIKRMMERSSRFISLSGWSGFAAGLCALAGAWVARAKISQYTVDPNAFGDKTGAGTEGLVRELVYVGAIVFVVACCSALFFTWLRCRKAGLPSWGQTARRLLWNTILPMAVGGIVILRLIEQRNYNLITACCLIFYGLALINGSKYTLGEVRWLGYAQLVLGIINLWMPGDGLVLWAAGFGVLHIIYGALMWWKYERG